MLKPDIRCRQAKFASRKSNIGNGNAAGQRAAPPQIETAPDRGPMTSPRVTDAQLFKNTLVLLLGVTVIGSNSFLLSPVLTVVSESLGTSIPAAAWSVSAYGGATALSGLLLSGLLQPLGYRATLVVTGLLLSLGVGITGLAWSLLPLIIGQALAGLGAGAMLPAAYAATAVIAPRGRESMILGKVIAGWSISLVVAVPVSALIADFLSWRIAYLVITLISLSAVAGFMTLPPDERASRQRRSTIRESLQVEGAIPTLAMIFLFMCAFYGTYTFLGTHIQADLKESTAASGLAVLGYGAGFGVASFWGGRIIDRYTPAVLTGPLLLGIGVLYFVAIPASGAFFFLTAWCFAWGVLNQFALNCLVTLLTQLSADHRMRLLGLYSVAAYGGAMVAAIVFGEVYGLAGFASLLGLAGILCLAGWVIASRKHRANN